MTERDIQDALYLVRHQDRHEPIVPNCSALGHEADLLSVTKARLVHEHEIKVSRADFKADARKQEKHAELASPPPPSYRGFLRVPNYFWYVTPPDLLDGLEVPEYAGHMVITVDRKPGPWYPLGFVRVLKPAPRLHRAKISDDQLATLMRGLMFRYWRQRLELQKHTTV